MLSKQAKKRIIWFLKFFQHIAEVILFCLFAAIIKIMPVKIASNFGSFIGRNLCYHIFKKANNTARKNLLMTKIAFSKKESDKIVKMMWDNLGRNGCEIFHLQKFKNDKFLNEHVEFKNVEILDEIKSYNNQGKGILILTAHYGNWELLPPIFTHKGFNSHSVYREANNKIIDYFVLRIRENASNKMIKKGISGIVEISKAIKSGKNVGILNDQRLTQGELVDFFGIPAKTAPLIASLSIKNDIPIFPIRIIRKSGIDFVIEFSPSIKLEQNEKSENKEENVKKVLAKTNKKIEDWIREYPHLWMWATNRWK